MDKTDKPADAVTQVDIDVANELISGFRKTSGCYYADAHDADHWIVKRVASIRQASIPQHEGGRGEPVALAEQACLISKTGCVVTIDCDDPDEANELFDWLTEAKYPPATRPAALAEGVQARVQKQLSDPYDGGIWEGRKLNKDPFVTIRAADAEALLEATRPAALGEDEDNKAGGLWYRRWKQSQDRIAVLESDITCRRQDRFEMASRITQQADEAARLRGALDQIELLASNHGGWADTDPWKCLAEIGQAANAALDVEAGNAKG